jgi:hypothetical protein
MRMCRTTGIEGECSTEVGRKSGGVGALRFVDEGSSVYGLQGGLS